MIWGRVAWWGAAAGMAAGLGLAVPRAPAVADALVWAEPPAGYTPITTGQGMCLDDTNDIGADGEPVQLWTCLGNRNQAWQAEPDGTIRNANGWCLGTGSAANSYAATANGTRLVMVACSQHYRGSYWTVNPFAHQIINKYADAAMDNQLDLQQNGNPVQLWSTATGWPKSQDWSAVPSGGGTPVVTQGNPPALHTNGANMVTSAGQVFVPRGFTLSTLESTKPSHDGAHAFSSVLSETEAQIDAIAGTWHGNIVRFQIEQDDLVQGLNGGENTDYLNLIRAVVSYAQAKGLVVVLNAQTEPGAGRYTLNEPLPTQETVKFWHILQPYYGNDASVIVDPFNEPRATSGLSVAHYMTLWKNGGEYQGSAYLGFQQLAETLRSDGYAKNMLWAEPPDTKNVGALEGLTDGGNYLLTGIFNISYSFHHPTVLGTARTPANWYTQFGDLVKLHELSVNDGEWNTRSDNTGFVASNGDSGPCWYDANTAVSKYLTYLQELGVGLTAWTLTDGAPGLGMTAESDPGTFTTTANMTGWPGCENVTPVLGPGALLMAWFGRQAGR
jgi:ricin-type beta-trefoil lectin protein/cellulase (glycosyl hydrolase family 5)